MQGVSRSSMENYPTLNSKKTPTPLDITTVNPTNPSDVSTKYPLTTSDVTAQNVPTTPNMTSTNGITSLQRKATQVTPNQVTLTTKISNTLNGPKSGKDHSSYCRDTFHTQVANICLLCLLLIVVLGLSIYHTRKKRRRQTTRLQRKMDDSIFRKKRVSDATVGSSSFQAARESCSRVILKPSGPAKVVRLKVKDNAKMRNKEPSMLSTTSNTNIGKLKWHHINNLTETNENSVGNIFTNETRKENNNNEVAMSHCREVSHASVASQSPRLDGEICDSHGDNQPSGLHGDELNYRDSFTESSCSIQISPDSSRTNSPTWSLDIRAPPSVDPPSQRLTKEKTLPMPPSQLPKQASGHFNAISSHGTSNTSRPASPTLSHLNSTPPLLPRKGHTRNAPSYLPARKYYPEVNNLPEPPAEMPFKPTEDPPSEKPSSGANALPVPPDCLPSIYKVSTLFNTFHQSNQIKKPRSCPSIRKQLSPLLSIRTAQRSVSKQSLSSHTQCSIKDFLPVPPNELPWSLTKSHDYISKFF